MKEIIEKIDGLSDEQVVEVLTEVHANLFSKIDYKDVVNNAIASDQEDIRYLAGLDAETKGMQKDIAEAGEAARNLLIYMARDDEYAKVVDDAITEISSSDHLSVVGVIVAIGLLANLTILVSTTRIKYIDGKITVIKGVAPTNLIKTILEPVKVLAETHSIS